jgi:hypothetical protein
VGGSACAWTAAWDWNEVEGAIEDAYARIAPKSPVEQARSAR